MKKRIGEEIRGEIIIGRTYPNSYPSFYFYLRNLPKIGLIKDFKFNQIKDIEWFIKRIDIDNLEGKCQVIIESYDLMIPAFGIVDNRSIPKKRVKDAGISLYRFGTTDGAFFINSRDDLDSKNFQTYLPDIVFPTFNFYQLLSDDYFDLSQDIIFDPKSGQQETRLSLLYIFQMIIEENGYSVLPL